MESQQKTLWATVLEETKKLPGPTPGERLHQNRGAVCRRAVQSGDPRLSRDNRRRKDVRPTGGRRG